MIKFNAGDAALFAGTPVTIIDPKYASNHFGEQIRIQYQSGAYGLVTPGNNRLQPINSEPEKPNVNYAFPGRDYETRPFTRGMELRDYLAAKALPVCMYNSERTKREFNIVSGTEGFKTLQRAIASMAYGFADAMLEVRKRKDPNDPESAVIG
jgi:hypothetical protein